MTLSATGAFLGAMAGLGVWLLLTRLSVISKGDFEDRVLRYLTDIPELRRPERTQATGGMEALLRPLAASAAQLLDRLVGGSSSVRRRIDRAGLDLTLEQFRMQQVTWGVVSFAGTAVLSMLVVWRSPDRAVPLLVLTAISTLAGVLLRDNRLTAQVRSHEEKVLAEMPAVAELLALSVAAGEGPVAALERVVQRSKGAFSRDLAAVLGAVRTGTSVAGAFDDYANRTGLPVVARFASGIAVAVERGTPLADVLHAQAADVREARRRTLIESGARREVAMMVPVVFLVLPITILFAFWPGVIGLRLVSP